MVIRWLLNGYLNGYQMVIRWLLNGYQTVI